MTRDFLKPQKTTGLDTNAPVGKQSRFASRPFARVPQYGISPEVLQTMRERVNNLRANTAGTAPPAVQQQAIPEEEKEENLQMKADEAVQRQELEEEETLQTKPESTIQPQELEEDETLQTKAEPTLQRQELPEEEDETVQTKLTIGQPGDKYEQEADNMASKVMSMADPTAENVQRQETEEEETLQQKPLADNVTPVVQRQTSETQPQDNASQNLESQLATEKGGGSPLSDEVRGFMEPRFGADFSEVRVHTGSAAVQMNQQLGAQAFTHGNDIYYGKGKAPGNDALMAHELTHTIQQGGSTNYPGISMQESNKKQGLTFSQWLHRKPGKKFQSLKNALLKKGYKFIIHILTETNNWQKITNREDIPWNISVHRVAWSVGYMEGKEQKWEWVKPPEIVEKSRQWLSSGGTSSEQLDLLEALGNGFNLAVYAGYTSPLKRKAKVWKSAETDNFRSSAQGFAKDHQAIGIRAGRLVFGEQAAMPITGSGEIIERANKTVKLVNSTLGETHKISTLAIFTHGLTDYLNFGGGNVIGINKTVASKAKKQGRAQALKDFAEAEQRIKNDKNLSKERKLSALTALQSRKEDFMQGMSKKEFQGKEAESNETVDGFVKEIKSSLAGNVKVVLYACLAGSTYKFGSETFKEVKSDHSTGGEGSFADVLRDTLVASEESEESKERNWTEAEVWGHRNTADPTMNPRWRVFAGEQDGDDASQPLFGQQEKALITKKGKPLTHKSAHRSLWQGEEVRKEKLLPRIKKKLIDDGYRDLDDLYDWIAREMPFIFSKHEKKSFVTEDGKIAPGIVRKFVERYKSQKGND